MSISTTATKDTYAGNASLSTPYPVTFKYLSSDHVTVYADGVDITNTCTFTDGTTGTGEFTTAAYAPTTTITVVLDVPLDQPVVLQETGSLPAKTIEVEGFDRLNMQVRRVWRKLQDVLTFNTDEAGASTGTADNLLGFDGSGDIAEIPNTTFAQTANDLSDLNDAATARTNINVDVAGTDNSTDVTVTGAGTYVTLAAGQILTVDEIEATELLSTGATVGQVLQSDGDTTCSFIDLIGGGNAQTANPLSQFAATTSAQLAGIISDETGTGSLVFATSPSLVTPDLGTPSALNLANATGTPSALNLANATGTPSAINLTNATNTPLPASDSITYEMVQDVTAANKILGSVAGGTVSEITCTSAGRALIDDADASAQRTTLGVAIGSDVQAYSSALDDLISSTSSSVTGTANFNNTTDQNITLTGIGNLGGTIEVGDVIQVTGSTANNKLFTVSSRTDADNIIVNEFHTTTASALEGNKRLATENSGTQTISLYCKAKYASAGLGCGWVVWADDTTSINGEIRDHDVDYTNTTGRDMVFAIYKNTRASSAILIDGVDVGTINMSVDGDQCVVTFTVPDGSTYKLDGANTHDSWSELR